MILSCSHLSKSFGSKTVIADASFHIEDHEKAAIVGINGAGKSTLLKMITGELSPDSGEVSAVKGENFGLPGPASGSDQQTVLFFRSF